MCLSRKPLICASTADKACSFVFICNCTGQFRIPTLSIAGHRILEISFHCLCLEKTWSFLTLLFSSKAEKGVSNIVQDLLILKRAVNNSNWLWLSRAPGRNKFLTICSTKTTYCQISIFIYFVGQCCYHWTCCCRADSQETQSGY